MTTETHFSLPRLNEPAPDFEAETTHGPKKLADDKGKWLVLFSHPSDFTPVCTTEFIAFAKAHKDFQSLNCELLGLMDTNAPIGTSARRPSPQIDKQSLRNNPFNRGMQRHERTTQTTGRLGCLACA